ncbi:MAG: AAA domain-containing protein [Candidatus Bathyarchaeia archaeon]
MDDEIDWVQKRGSGKRVRLYAGEKRSSVGGAFYYAFKLDEELRGLSDDTPIELIFESIKVNGTIVAITPNQITIAVERNLGDKIESAVLVSQAVFILVGLRKRLSQASGNRRLANKVLDGEITTDYKDTQVDLPSVQRNSFQEEAVLRVARQSVSYIWGPPGTGKTWTIGLAAYALSALGDSILVVSNTNVAVDRAVEIMCKVVPNDNIIRLGNPTQQFPNNVIFPDKEEEEQSSETWRIVATTFAKSFTDSRFSNLKFDTVIVDEASMAPIPAIYHSAMLAKKRVLIVGDFEQLPPIAMNKESVAVRDWLMRDAFEVAGISQNPKQSLAEGRLIMLRRQYRMNPQISALVNQLTYNGLLENGTTQVANVPPIPESPLIFVDTTSLNTWCKKSSTSNSKYNLYHAFLAVGIAEKILEAKKTPAIITPYADQAHRIRLILRDRHLDDKILASTVHRFQGQEADAIIYDISDSDGTTPHWLESDTSKRLMNVAFSRAKDKLVVIGNRSFLFRKLPAGNAAREAIEYVEKHGSAISGAQFLPPDFKVIDPSAKRLRTEEYDILKESQISTFTEQTFYPAFLSDIDNAKHEVIIFSPFATRRRIGMLSDDLRNLVERGVKVSIYTRPPRQMFDTTEDKLDDNLSKGATDAVQYLKQIKTNVELRPRMHEKLAVIDLRTCWIGSLNILSHAPGATRETMIRLQGLEKTIQHIIDDVLQRRSEKKEITITKISELKEGMKGLYVEGVIAMMATPRRVKGGLKIADSMLTDGSGTVKLVLWEDQTRQAHEGVKLRVVNGYTTSFRGTLQLNAGKYGRIEVVQK